MKESTLYYNQFKAILIRNITLKKREKRKTLVEILLPFYSFAVLAFLKISIPNPYFPAINYPPYAAEIFDNYSIHLNYTIAVIPNTTEIQAFLDSMSLYWDKIREEKGNKLTFVLYETKDDLQEQYWHESNWIPLAVIFNTSDPVTEPLLDYEIRTNPSFTSAPTSVDLYSSSISCRENSHILAKALENSHMLGVEDCPAYRYYASGFITLQMLIDYTKMSIMYGDKLNVKSIKLQLFPKEAYTADWMLLFRLVIPAYLVMSLSQFVTYLLMMIVSEKEKKIRECMKIMGLKDSIFWLSWFSIYALFVSAMSVVATISMFLLGVFQHSDFFLILILILLYGFSTIFFCFMLTPFFNNARSAGILGNFTINILSLLYFIRIFISKLKTEYLWCMSLISSPAFTLAMDKALTMDMSGDGINFENLWNGPGLSFGNSLIILSFDTLLYAILAYYLDLVIPSEYGAKRKPWFFITPIFKVLGFIFKKQKDTNLRTYITSDSCNNDDIEPVSSNLRNKVGIEIVNIHKHFSSCRGSQVSAINGINLTIYEGQITAILGHNGAGKTTLFNILTGMTKPSSGTAYIFGHDISNSGELNKVRKMFGVCPQHDILFDNLTTREHLKLYGAIRGIPSSELNTEITRTIKDCNFEENADTLAKFLSGGQKRKLSVAIAIIGSPKILIFDEPTAGVDPCSRRNMWSLLRQNKAGKVILLTTHFMDEADILADRKAVISKGQLRCVGSSLFLKNKFGIGYHLTLVLEANNAQNEIIRLVRRYVAELEIARQHGKELSLILPHNSVNKFATLFTQLDKEIHEKGNRLKISSYGISMTTLEEVFLYLEKHEDVEGEEGTITNRIVKRRISNMPRSMRKRRISSVNSESSEDSRGSDVTCVYNTETVEISKTHVSGLGLDAIKVNPNFYQISRAMIKLRLLNIYRDPYRFILITIIPLVFSAMGLYFNVKEVPELKMKSLILNRNTYTNTSLVIQDKMSSDNLLKYLDTTLDYNSANATNLIKIKPNIGAIKISTCCDEIDITIMYNDTATHSLPVILNILNNAFYRILAEETPSNYTAETLKIVTRSFPFLMKSRPEEFDFGLVSSAVCLGAAFIVIPIIFASDFVYDREIKAKNLLRVNGLKFSYYFGTFFIVLTAAMLLILLLHLIMIIFFDLPSFRQPVAFSILTFFLILYTPCSILFSFGLSYLFNKADTAQSILLNCASFVGLLPFALVLFLDMTKVGAVYILILHAIFSIFDAFYLPFAIIYFVGRVYLLCLANEACTYITVGDYLTPEILIIFVSCCIQIPVLIFLLRLLELWKSTGSSRLRKQPKEQTSIENDNPGESVNGEDDCENDDVKFEKYRVANFMNSMTDSPDHPVVIAQNLNKIYQPTNKNVCGNLFKCSKTNDRQLGDTTLAIENLSFAVRPGEIFGLLGHNGAGKTTTMKIITAEETPTNGRAQVKGYNVSKENFKNIFHILGYCPQQDVLWKNITVTEHIELYAAIRGVPADKIKDITETYLSALQIKEHANKRSYQCSGGTKRKLSFAIAMVGNPCVVLLDEPSAGMDPHSKRFLWDTILCSFQVFDQKSIIFFISKMTNDDFLTLYFFCCPPAHQGIGYWQHNRFIIFIANCKTFLQGSRGAILTTHAMEEADALCSRVGIMVNGKLRCVGSTQHLKNLYGAGYTLEIKINSDDGYPTEKEQIIKQFVNDVFPLATLEETFSDHLIFSIPQSSVKSLARCFSEIENAKRLLSIEEYSFSQTTLEQVFLKFARNNHKSQ